MNISILGCLYRLSVPLKGQRKCAFWNDGVKTQLGVQLEATEKQNDKVRQIIEDKMTETGTYGMNSSP